MRRRRFDNRRPFDFGEWVAVILIVVGIIVVIMVLAGCDTQAPAVKDLPVENQKTDIADRLIYVSPDGFPNVVVWCDGKSRIYVTSREAQPIVVVPDSPECVG